VDSALPSARPPLEVLDGVREVDTLPVDARARQGVVEHTPGWADERAPLDVLAIAGLLADEQNPRVRRALAENGLRRILPESAGTAVGRICPHLRQ
jgi:hypothetical protein